ncbi:MAG TPA: hypothetical protein VKQ54_17945 [Caulobacteraceae bacterium]|nr:hypothetical protein [Caulobacteraceae bacterium]
MAQAAGRTLDAALALAAAGLALLIVRSAVTDVQGADRRPDPARLVRDPLDLPSLRFLGLRLDREGHLAEADVVLRFVGSRTWRDGPTEVWLLRRRLDEGRYREALESADSLLRRDAEGTTRPALFPLLIAAAEDAGARPALVARLVAAPWWRGDFLRALGAQGDAAGALAVFSALARGQTPAAAAEYAPLVDRLVSAGDYGGAYAAWRAIARSREAAAPVLRDGDFTGASDHTPFTWSAAAGVGASGATDLTPDGPATRALRIDYDGFSSPTLPAQLLADTPRRYTLSWRQRIDPAAPERLAWRVRCADTGRVLARAPAAVPGWREATMSVETPPSGCAAQWLELAAEPGERRSPVTAWYAAFRLRQAAPGASARAGAAE